LIDIERLAFKFRAAIETALQDGALDTDVMFCNFPNGCCGDTCDLLAQYFLDHDIKTKRVVGSAKTVQGIGKQTHAWLLFRNCVIVDITGDQFIDDSTFLNYCNPVFVGKRNRFYKLFSIDTVEPFAGICALDSCTQKRLSDLYVMLTRYIVD
jgi:hypothetical protein